MSNHSLDYLKNENIKTIIQSELGDITISFKRTEPHMIGLEIFAAYVGFSVDFGEKHIGDSDSHHDAVNLALKFSMPKNTDRTA